jgi:hypothetical protein
VEPVSHLFDIPDKIIWLMRPLGVRRVPDAHGGHGHADHGREQAKDRAPRRDVRRRRAHQNGASRFRSMSNP